MATPLPVLAAWGLGVRGYIMSAGIGFVYIPNFLFKLHIFKLAGRGVEVNLPFFVSGVPSPSICWWRG
jgi:hypothetical protein